MCKPPCVLAVVAMYVAVAQSWDIAVSLREQLVFYSNGTKTDTVNLIFQNPTALVYDEIHNMMLYVDKQNNNDAVCGYDLSSKDNKCFIKRNGRNIHGLAFDPVTEIIFFTDTNERTINWISLKRGSNNNIYGNLLIKLDDGIPTEITVDSCRGYIYWVNTNISHGHMERARFNGSEREIMYNRDLTIHSLVIDPQTRKMYYFDGMETQEYLNNADLDCEEGNNLHLQNEIIKLILNKPVSESKVLTVSKEYIYWMNGSESYNTVWKLPKNAEVNVEPEAMSKFYNERTLSIATNYDKIKELQDCITVMTLERINSDGPFCVHGVKVNGQSRCKCTPGYIGERCDVSLCKNYCLQGDCRLNDEGLPMCRCKSGYSGQRCQDSVCFNFCLNNGDCFLGEEDEPVCQCAGNYEGSRCESDINNTTPTYDLEKRNFTLADLVSTLRKPSSKMYLTFEVKDSNFNKF